ncbi:hypothetical protein LMG27952_05568 [Paraburkholderia hiiakae]|uniref:Uncharacterized protein n=1 Tax=Paraburkholderia hiiakae TaxID=1081782 RepID=A0ABM8P299_9BURK|nr:hypothetical protein LMG27952_05568 [Paraburkholderia hiiakae]
MKIDSATMRPVHLRAKPAIEQAARIYLMSPFCLR